MTQVDLKGRHLTHVRDLTDAELIHLLDGADGFVDAARGDAASPVSADGRIIATLFFEPSTRTRLSFEAAMARLGGRTLTAADSAGLSTKKGETLSDTIRMASGYADLIVLRHPHEGAARLAAQVSGVPVVNAGDGAGQHPTQTLVDLFTIRRNLGTLEGHRVALVGDLKYGRTVHSLAEALGRFGCEVVEVAPANLGLPDSIRGRLDALGAKVTQEPDLAAAVGSADVVYMTRIQAERFPDAEEYARVRGTYSLTADLVARMKKSSIVLHPLPRVDEVHRSVDDLPQAKYFEQAANGVPVRMAVLANLLGLGGA